MIIRAATEHDILGIVGVGRQSFTGAFGHLFPADVLARYLANTYSVPKITASLAQPNNVYFVAESSAGVVGFLKLKRDCPHRLVPEIAPIQLQKIYILPGCTDAGIGSQLMQVGEQTIRSSPSRCAWLMMYEGNHRAAAFYRRFGYSAIGQDTHDFEQIRVNFIVMQKDYRTT